MVALARGLGHNLGRRHAPCAPGDTDRDVAYPYADGRIGVPGHDVRSWGDGLSGSALSQSPALPDIMAPCLTSTFGSAARWISDYTYRAVLETRGFTPVPAGAGAHSARSARATVAPVERVLIVRGRIADDGVEIEPAFATDARATRPERRGAFRLELRGRDGRVLFADDFAPSALVSSAHGHGHFLFAIPLTDQLARDVATIHVRGPAGVATRARSIGSVSRSPGGRATARVVRAGLSTVTCDDDRAAGVLVRDADTGEFLATAARSSLTIAARAGRRITVVCSDGVQSTGTTTIVR
jgi:hypothetical protein